jgi:hypothetical protein
MTVEESAPTDAGQTLVDAAQVRRAIEHYFEHDFSDGLPVVPATESYVAEFLAQVDRDPDEVLAVMAHLNRECTVKVAAINAAMAGCRPEYFPVVVAALDAMRLDTNARGASRFSSGLWQSTTGTVPIMVINGPVRERLGFNSKGNLFGPGFRANATLGRTMRLIALNAFGLKPHVLDQSTHSNPAKYTCCIAENEEESPWEPLSVEAGFGPSASTVAFMMMRSIYHIEARSAIRGEQVLEDIANSISRTGVLYSETTSCLVVVSPEHAHLLAGQGFSKDDVKAYLAKHAVCTRAELERAGKTGVSRGMRWLVPADHPDAVPGELPLFVEGPDGEQVHPVLASPDDVVVVVAGAANAGVSSVVELMGSASSPSGRGGRRVPVMGEIALRP